MNIRENNTKERNLKEKIKNFWKNYKKNILWVNIGSCTCLTIMNWAFFFLGFVNLAIVILFTVFYPLLIILGYYIKVSKRQKIITKIMLVGCGGFVLGDIIWLLTGSAVLYAPWAPLHSLPQGLKITILLLLMVPSFGFSVYIMYRIGKKREWRPPSHLLH